MGSHLLWDLLPLEGIAWGHFSPSTALAWQREIPNPAGNREQLLFLSSSPKLQEELMFAAAQVGRDCYFEGGWSCCWTGKCALTSGEAAQPSAPEVGQVCRCHSSYLAFISTSVPIISQAHISPPTKAPCGSLRIEFCSSFQGEWINYSSGAPSPRVLEVQNERLWMLSRSCSSSGKGSSRFSDCKRG